MLVLSRLLGQSIVIDGNTRVTVLEFQGRCVKLGIDAPRGISVNREEVELKIKQGEQDDADRGDSVAS